MPFQKKVTLQYPTDEPDTSFPVFGYIKDLGRAAHREITLSKVHQFVFDTRFKVVLRTYTLTLEFADPIVDLAAARLTSLPSYVGRVLVPRKPHHVSTEAIVASMPVEDASLPEATRKLINQVVNGQIPMPEDRRAELTALPAYQQKLSRIHYFIDPCVEGSQGIPLYDCTKDQVGGVEFFADAPAVNNRITINGTIVADLFRENEIEMRLAFISGAPGFARHVVLKDGIKPQSYIIELYEEGRPGTEGLGKTICYVEAGNREDLLPPWRGRQGYQPRYVGPEEEFDPNKDYPNMGMALSQSSTPSSA